MDAAKGSITIQGKSCPIDSIESYMVGPGCTYSRYAVTMTSSRTVQLYILEADLTNPYVKVEQRNAKGQIGVFETVAAAHAALDAPNHRTIGSVNCNFFWTSSSSTIGLAGNPTGGTVTDGIIATQPDEWNMGAQNTGVKGWNDMGYVAIDQAGKCIMDNFAWDGKITIGEQSYSLRDCNRQRTDPNTDEIALFNYKLSYPTRTLAGTEVIFSVDQWRINSDIQCTVTAINTTGGTTIPQGHGALQCRGTGADFVQGLQVGSTFTLNLGFYSTNDQSRPNILQLCMGNALCMAADTLTQRNYNEGYNTQVYARTGMATNTQGNRLWLMVMQTPGMSTAEMCDVFRQCGATYAVGCDGGGSAQLGLFGVVQNKTTEATPRALNNGLWLFSTAPDSQVAGQLRYVDSTPTDIPAYASYTPQVRAYTAEGNFLTHDFQDFTLSVEPATLGTISEDGRTFTANPVNGEGTLTASYGTATVSKTIRIRDGQVQLRLDSVIVGNSGYKMEVNALSGELVLPIDPIALTWTSEDPSIAMVEEGQIVGLQNGKTRIMGALGEYRDTLMAIVELSSAPVLRANGDKVEHEHASLDTAFTLTKTRNVTIAMPIHQRLWGCPDSLICQVQTTAPVHTITITGTDAYQHKQSYKFSAVLPLNQDTLIWVGLDHIASIQDQGVYPITIDEIVFGLNNPKTNTAYAIQLKDILVHYPNWQEPTDLEHTQAHTPLSTSSAQWVWRHGQMVLWINGVYYTLLGIPLQD